MVQAESKASAPRRRPWAVRAVRRFWHLLTSSSDRYVFWLLWRRNPNAYQPFNCTAKNRYPYIFGFVRSRLADDDGLRVLSFGCSTGEEVFTLRRYFPNAFIKGIDINPANIAVARQRAKSIGDTRVAFEIADSAAGEPTETYDAVFCMAVLRHGKLGKPGVTRCDHLLSFARFCSGR